MSKIATCAGARAMVLAATAALAGCALGPRSHTGLEHRAQGVDTATVAWAMAELCRDEHPATDPRAGGPVPVLAHADGSFTIQIARLGIGSPYRCAMDGRLTEPTPELRADGALVLAPPTFLAAGTRTRAPGSGDFLEIVVRPAAGESRSPHVHIETAGDASSPTLRARLEAAMDAKPQIGSRPGIRRQPPLRPPHCSKSSTGAGSRGSACCWHRSTRSSPRPGRRRATSRARDSLCLSRCGPRRSARLSARGSQPSTSASHARTHRTRCSASSRRTPAAAQQHGLPPAHRTAWAIPAEAGRRQPASHIGRLDGGSTAATSRAQPHGPAGRSSTPAIRRSDSTWNSRARGATTGRRSCSASNSSHASASTRNSCSGWPTTPPPTGTRRPVSDSSPDTGTNSSAKRPGHYVAPPTGWRRTPASTSPRASR